jgi:dipeptide transport system substrate-binding protein
MMKQQFRLSLRRGAFAFGAFSFGAIAITAVAQAAGTLTVCTEGPPDGFDVVQYESAVTNDAAGLTIYDQLINFKPGGTEVVPGLAQKWEISADGLVVTLQLRRGVKFHTTPWFKPTRDFNADDVLWSVNRVNDKKNPTASPRTATSTGKAWKCRP